MGKYSSDRTSRRLQKVRRQDDRYIGKIGFLVYYPRIGSTSSYLRVPDLFYCPSNPFFDRLGLAHHSVLLHVHLVVSSTTTTTHSVFLRSQYSPPDPFTSIIIPPCPYPTTNHEEFEMKIQNINKYQVQYYL